MTFQKISSKQFLKGALNLDPLADLNRLHQITFNLMKKWREDYYEAKITNFLKTLDLDEKIKNYLKDKMLAPIIVEDKQYSNIMEEISRRISQSFQVLSGNIAELIAERELKLMGLVLNDNYVRKKEGTDLILYYPNKNNFKKKHRVEVKNVKLRERATRGLAFDGDSLFGFFDDPSELTDSTIREINNLCTKTQGFCYLPPQTLEAIMHKSNDIERFTLNTRFGEDMKCFVETGIIG